MLNFNNNKNNNINFVVVVIYVYVWKSVQKIVSKNQIPKFQESQDKPSIRKESDLGTSKW